MALKPIKPSKQARNSKKQAIKEVMRKQEQERKGLEFPLPDAPTFKPMG